MWISDKYQDKVGTETTLYGVTKKLACVLESDFHFYFFTEGNPGQYRCFALFAKANPPSIE